MTKEEKVIIEKYAWGMATLSNWYQDSIDETQEPVWTDKHLEELYNDFYLIPKQS